MVLFVESDGSMLYIKYTANGKKKPLYIGHFLPHNGAFEFAIEKGNITNFIDNYSSRGAILTEALKNPQKTDRIIKAVSEFKPKNDLEALCKRNSLASLGVFKK